MMRVMLLVYFLRIITHFKPVGVVTLAVSRVPVVASPLQFILVLLSTKEPVLTLTVLVAIAVFVVGFAFANTTIVMVMI